MKTVPEDITQDPLWRLDVDRLGFFIADITWDDTETLFKNPITRNASDQIRHSPDSISANIAEGYSRSTGKDRARYFEYSLDFFHLPLFDRNHRNGIPTQEQKTCN